MVSCGGSHGRTVSSISSSEAPFSKASSLRKLAAMRRASRRLSLPSDCVGADQEVSVGDRLADLERCVPGGKHGEVVLVERADRFGVVDRQLRVGKRVDPRVDDLRHELTTGLSTDAVGDYPDRVLRFDEAKGHWQPI